ncbi:hypothetical protein A3K73_03320 [Candidatus Pacearchaeota archaeon RBG_13_36_9]|nr:MAG: hypothetical protein A3K73_03320 [Candidatus Pacearchaeota archaeon RBG_13_36_9]
MSEEYSLTRRDFIKIVAGAAAVTAYATKTAGARDAESALENGAGADTANLIEGDCERELN